MKKLYEVVPAMKKSLIEREVFEQDEGDQVVLLETLWRSGTFVLALTDEEKAEITDFEEVLLSDYPCYMLDTWDGVDFEITLRDSNLSEEEHAKELERLCKINEEEFMSSWLEDNGYTSDGCFYETECPVLIKLCEDQDEYTFLLDE